MLRRVQCTFPRANWLVVVPAAIVLASCGGSIGGDSVTGVSVDEMAVEAAVPPDEDGTVTEEARKKKVEVCHKGRTVRVAWSSITGHLKHGDTLGRCTRAVTCPCFSAEDIQVAGTACDTTVHSTCSTGDPYYLLMSCDPGGSVPPGILGVYLSQTADGGECSRDDIFGSFSQDGLSDAEYQACVNAIGGSGYCF